MNHQEMSQKIGETVTETEMVDMIKSLKICSAEDDVKMRSSILSFTFGQEVELTDVEDRQECENG